MPIPYDDLRQALGVRSMNKLGEALGMSPDYARGTMARLKKTGKLPAEQYRPQLFALLAKHGLNGTEHEPQALANDPLLGTETPEASDDADAQGIEHPLR